MKNLSLILCVLLGLFSCKGKLHPEEAAIRENLKVDASIDTLIILSQAAHMDWDWLNPYPYNQNETPPQFQSYFNGNTQPASTILASASNLLGNPSYYYSVCETGFLQGFAQDNPTSFQAMVNSGRLRIVGGGITSPDNLLPHGETFIRNYLVGKTWLDGQNIPFNGLCWIPDDFGHNSQLPITLEAMGIKAAGFSRLPNGVQQQNNCAPSGTAAASYLLGFGNDPNDDGGITFNWMADDGSQTIGHFMEAHYSQGDDINQSDFMYGSPAQVNNRQTGLQASTPNEHINGYKSANGPVSPTPYIYVHVSNDFIMPKESLLTYVSGYNAQSAPNVKAVVATFDDYVNLVAAYQKRPGVTQMKTRSWYPDPAKNVFQFQPAPYWMGFYASRPENKILHYRASRTLLGAEVFTTIADLMFRNGQSHPYQAGLDSAWIQLVPSTHHDYITGTAKDSVYLKEQIPLLQDALSRASTLSNQSINEIVSQIPAPNGSVIAFNANGFPDTSIVELLTPGVGPIFMHLSSGGFGYRTLSQTSALNPSLSPVSATALSGGAYKVSNGIVSFEINAQGELTTVRDEVTATSVLSGTGNKLKFFNDYGGIYRYGYEQGNSWSEYSATPTNISVQSVDYGNLCQEIIVSRTFSLNGTPKTFRFSYRLLAGEPQIRMSVRGSLPDNFTCMTTFPFAGNIDSLEYGTPYHWTTQAAETYCTRPFNGAFQATHDFVIPKNGTTRMAALYHKAVPAWTTQGSTLYGTLLRNTPSNGSFGANGHDYGEHTQEFVLRIPRGLTSPSTGKPLREARSYNNPLIARIPPVNQAGPLILEYSLAGISGNAILSTAKWSSSTPNQLVLRTYQPGNGVGNYTLSINANFSTWTPMTALEVGTASPYPISGTPLKIPLNMNRAIRTIGLDF